MTNIQTNRIESRPAPQNEISEIRRLKALLDYLGILNDLIPPSEETKFEQLYLTFLNEDQTPGRFLMILAFLNEITNLNGLDKENITHNLQFFVPIGLDLKIDDSNILQVLNLIARFNHFLPLGLFGISAENQVYFRYTLPSKHKRTDNILFVEIVEMIEFYLNSLGDSILAFLEKTKTHEQALEDGINALTNVVNKT